MNRGSQDDVRDVLLAAMAQLQVPVSKAAALVVASLEVGPLVAFLCLRVYFLANHFDIMMQNSMRILTSPRGGGVG